MKYTTRQSTLAKRGRANIQVMATTRDELKRLAGEHGKTILDMVEVLVLAWNANARRVADHSKMESVSAVKMNVGDTAYALEIEHADYDRHLIACDGVLFEFMVHDMLSHCGALYALIDGYKRG